MGSKLDGLEREGDILRNTQMTIYVFSGFYEVFIVGATSEERAREIGEVGKNLKLERIYGDGEEFVEYCGG